jgi:hypothetical protein
MRDVLQRATPYVRYIYKNTRDSIPYIYMYHRFRIKLQKVRFHGTDFSAGILNRQGLLQTWCVSFLTETTHNL